MKFLGYFLLVAAAVVIISTCSRTSEPTSPDFESAVSIRYNETKTINNQITIKFLGVPADSRCPLNAFCFWEGDGEVSLNLSDGINESRISLHTNLEPKEYVFSGYRIILKSLDPYPKSDTTYKAEDYKVELMIHYEGPAQSEKVELIDNENNSGIKKDLLNVNSVSLNRDKLNFNFSYTGGCKTHNIDLFALKGIQKSNPAQVTLMLSHDAANDNCEAIIHKDENFDLTPLKEYLKSHFNIQDKVILLLFDPQGRPLRNPVIEYNLQ